MSQNLQHHIFSKIITTLFRTKDGAVVISQFPNGPLFVWIGSTIALKVAPVNLTNLFTYLSFGALFTWAWLELTGGVNLFRRTLGAVVLAFILIHKVRG